MSFDNRGVDEDQTVLAFFGERFQYLLPHTAFAPSVVPIVNGRVRPIPFRQVAPRRARTQNVEDAIQDFAVILALRPATIFGQQRLDHRPGVVVQPEPSTHPTDLQALAINPLKHMASQDMFIKVFPYDTSFETLSEWNPDGYFLSNGPGDPEPLKGVQAVAKKIMDANKPLFGICLGHQIIALANGIPTFKMFNGHRGINHPVKNIISGKGEITSQNHGFAVDMEAAKNHPDIEITHLHLNDHTLAGMRLKDKNCFSVQYHPEAGPGPNDATYLFKQFKELITNQ